MPVRPKRAFRAVRLDASNLPYLARGCAVLGGGGGGDPDLALAMALRAVEERGPVPVVPLAGLPPDALVMPCGLVGAPSVAAERIPNGDEGSVLAAAVEELRGAGVGALMAYEIAGANGVMPVAWAARAGLPLVDADGMGRAFPGLHQQAIHLSGIAASPVVLTDGRGNTLVVRAADDRWAERLARSAAASLGGVCAGALYCMVAAEARGAVIEGSLSLAVALGRAPAPEPSADGGRKPASAAGAHDAVVLLDGKVLDVERDAEAGFARGSATVQGVGSHAGRRLRIELQNEYVLAVEDGAVCAVVPDIISVLGAGTGVPLATERLRHGQRVTVVVVPVAAVWRSAAGLAIAGPGAFGLDVDYVPITGGGGDGGA